VLPPRPKPWRRGPGQPCLPYLALLHVGFALPPLSPAERCALTAPFHPYRGVAAEAVCFLWHFPSTGLESGVPDVIRHTALRSSDFPLPMPEGIGSDRPARSATRCALPKVGRPSFGSRVSWSQGTFQLDYRVPDRRTRLPPCSELPPCGVASGLSSVETRFSIRPFALRQRRSTFRQTPAAGSTFLACIFETIPKFSLARSVMNSRPRLAFYGQCEVRSMSTTRCQVRFRNSTPVVRLPLPVRISQSLRIVAPSLIPRAEACLCESPDLPSLPAALE